MRDGFCWGAYPEFSGECLRENITMVWRNGRVAMGCSTCMTTLSEFMDTRTPRQPDTLGEWRDSADLVREADLGS